MYADQAALDPHARTDHSRELGEKLLAFGKVSDIEFFEGI